MYINVVKCLIGYKVHCQYYKYYASVLVCTPSEEEEGSMDGVKEHCQLSEKGQYSFTFLLLYCANDRV